MKCRKKPFLLKRKTKLIAVKIIKNIYIFNYSILRSVRMLWWLFGKVHVESYSQYVGPQREIGQRFHQLDEAFPTRSERSTRKNNVQHSNPFKIPGFLNDSKTHFDICIFSEITISHLLNRILWNLCYRLTHIVYDFQCMFEFFQFNLIFILYLNDKKYM